MARLHGVDHPLELLRREALKHDALGERGLEELVDVGPLGVRQHLVRLEHLLQMRLRQERLTRVERPWLLALAARRSARGGRRSGGRREHAAVAVAGALVRAAASRPRAALRLLVHPLEALHFGRLLRDVGPPVDGAYLGGHQLLLLPLLAECPGLRPLPSHGADLSSHLLLAPPLRRRGHGGRDLHEFGAPFRQTRFVCKRNRNLSRENY